MSDDALRGAAILMACVGIGAIGAILFAVGRNVVGRVVVFVAASVVAYFAIVNSLSYDDPRDIAKAMSRRL